MERLLMGIVAQALLDYKAGKLSRQWFKEQTLVDMDFSPVLRLIDSGNAVIMENIRALL